MGKADDWDMSEVTRLMEKAIGWKQQMLKRRLPRARAKCEQPESMVISCNIEGNQHMRCHCENCGAGFIE